MRTRVCVCVCVWVVQVAANEPVAPVGPLHVVDVGDAAALRARGVGRAVQHLVVGVEAEGAHRQQLLAQLAVGRQRVDVALPCAQQERARVSTGCAGLNCNWLTVAAVVALARRERVVAAALAVSERRPRVGRLVAAQAAHDARGAVLGEAIRQLKHELVRARLGLEERILVAPHEDRARHDLGWRGGGAGLDGRRRRRRRRVLDQRGDALVVGGHHGLRVDQVLGEGDQVLVHGDVGARLRERVDLRLPDLVHLVVAQQHVAVVAVGARDLDVGGRARGDRVVDADFLGCERGGGWARSLVPGRSRNLTRGPDRGLSGVVGLQRGRSGCARPTSWTRTWSSRSRRRARPRGTAAQRRSPR